jgi:hypothetical protein
VWHTFLNSNNVSRLQYYNNLSCVYDIQQNDTKHNDIQRNGLICDTQVTQTAFSITTLNMECCYAECHCCMSHFIIYAGCHYAKCRYAECRGIIYHSYTFCLVFSFIITSHSSSYPIQGSRKRNHEKEQFLPLRIHSLRSSVLRPFHVFTLSTLLII